MTSKLNERELLDKLINTFDLLCKCFVIRFDVLESLDHIYIDNYLVGSDHSRFIFLLDTTRCYLGLGEKVLHYFTHTDRRYYPDDKELLPTPVPVISYEFNSDMPRFCKGCDNYSSKDGISINVPALDRNFGRKISQVFFDKPDIFDKLSIIYNRNDYNYAKYIYKYIDGYMTRIYIKETYEDLVKLKETGQELFEITNDSKSAFNVGERLISTIFNIDNSVFKNLINYNQIIRDFEDRLWSVLETLFGITKHEGITSNDKGTYTMFITKEKPSMFMTIEPIDACLGLRKNDYSSPYSTNTWLYNTDTETITKRYYAEYKPTLKLRLEHGIMSLNNSTTIDMFDPDAIDKIIKLINTYLNYDIKQEDIDKEVKYIDGCCLLYKAVKALKECCNLIIQSNDYIRLDKNINVNPDKNIMITLSDDEINNLNGNTGIIFKKKVPGYQKNIETVYICNKEGRVKYRCKLACINYLKDMTQFSKDIIAHKVDKGITKEIVRKYFNGGYKAYILKEIKRMLINCVEAPITVNDFYIDKPPTTYQYIRSIRYNDNTSCLAEQEFRENNCNREQQY